MDSALSHGPLPTSANATQRRTTWLVALTFGLACLAWLDASSTYHGDEHFYFDAALRMWEGESWWAPEYADGSARVNKPLLSYWLSAGSMELLGPGLFAGRLPFVIAAVASLLATARLARALLPGEHGAAALVPAMLAATSTTVTLSTRCTPDILLVLGVTCTWVGLAELLVAGRSPASCARWIWGGCALAAAAKGSLARAAGRSCRADSPPSARRSRRCSRFWRRRTPTQPSSACACRRFLPRDRRRGRNPESNAGPRAGDGTGGMWCYPAADTSTA